MELELVGFDCTGLDWGSISRGAIEIGSQARPRKETRALESVAAGHPRVHAQIRPRHSAQECLRTQQDELHRRAGLK